MKKIIAIAALLVMTATAAKAQFSFGLKGGANISTLSLSDYKANLDTSNRTGFYVGPTVKFSLPIVGLGVDIAALYNQRTSKIDNYESDGSAKNLERKSISVPLNLRYQLIGIGDAAGLYVFTGPQFDFNIGDKTIDAQNYKDALVEYKNEWTMKSSDFSWNVGLGAMVMKHLQVNVNYNIGISKTSDISVTEIYKGVSETVTGSTKQNTWQIGLAYWF